MKQIKMNSKEIAKLAGVSRSTVSRVVNNYNNVPAKTREKVMRVIQENNYFPSVQAQILAGKKSKTIGLFLMEPGRVSNDSLTNRLLVSVIEQAAEQGYYVLTNIIRDRENTDVIQSTKEMFYQGRIDAGIFIGANMNEPLIEELVEQDFIIGVTDYLQRPIPKSNLIVANFNNDSGLKQSVAYLVGLGHTKIGLINGDFERLSGMKKLEGFKAAMKNSSLEINDAWVVPGGFSINNGYEAMKQMLSSHTDLPTAIITANDSVAFGAIKVLRESGLKIPKDISIIGFDDHELSQLQHPSLTTVKVDFQDLLRNLTIEVISKVELRSDEIKDIFVECTLLIRNSCTRI